MFTRSSALDSSERSIAVSMASLVVLLAIRSIATVTESFGNGWCGEVGLRSTKERLGDKRRTLHRERPVL